jgi:hypothetical protein
MQTPKTFFHPQKSNPFKTAVKEWLGEHEWDVAITLTFKKPLTEAEAENIIALFWRRIDRSIFKNAVKHGKRCERACFVEIGGFGGLAHYHMIARSPDRMSTERYCAFLHEYWKHIKEAGEVKIVATYDNAGWIDYIAKKVTTFATHNIDVRNTHIAG